jgi:hypothetical protein
MGQLGAVNVKQNERKSKACALTMLRISKAASCEGLGVEEWLCNKERIQFSSSTLETFFFDSKQRRFTLCAAPAESMLEEFMPEHMTEGTSKGQRCAATVARAAPIALREFSRLIMILIDDESVRSGLLATAQCSGMGCEMAWSCDI